MLVVVPDSLRDAIYAKVDAALEEVPDAAPDRDVFYDNLLSYFNEHGVVPDFTLVPRSTIIGTLKKEAPMLLDKDGNRSIFDDVDE